MLKERLAKIKKNLTRQYKVEVYDKESLTQTRNMTWRPLGVAALMGTFGLFLIAGTTALIFWVPALHRLIPGFQDPVVLEQKYALLQAENDSLEYEVEKFDTMLAAFSRIAGMNNPTLADQEMWAEVTPEPEANGLPDTAPALGAQTPPISGESPTEARFESPLPVRRPPETVNLISPLDGIITNHFKILDEKNARLDENAHYGIDIVADDDSFIKSVADGVVIFSEYSNTTGHVIGIWHGQQNLVSFYKHNSKVFRKVGDYVFSGEAIAVIGNTGTNSSGTHLHFELWYDNNPVDPSDYILFN